MRSVAPYIHAFRNKTFVVAFGGELVQEGRLNALVQDVGLLHAMGIHVVLVHGSRPQVEEQLNLHGVESEFSHGLRITDARALESAKEAAGEVRLDIEAAISQGLPNTPMAHAHISVVSGNFVTARPVGILDGVDFQHTGVVRKIDGDSIRHSLTSSKLVPAFAARFFADGRSIQFVDGRCGVGGGHCIARRQDHFPDRNPRSRR